MAESSIAWTDYTLNWWRGCQKVGPGCDFCYAKARDDRYEGGAHWGPGAPRILAKPPTRNAPLKWARDAAATGKRKVFAASLADIFDNAVDPSWRADFWDMVRRTPELRYQLVTKRIGNAADMLPDDFPIGFAHVGIMSTVVTQDEAIRDIPKLLRLKDDCGVTWVGLSVEPQLEVLDLTKWIEQLDWVICGGESRQGAGSGRLFNLDWARLLMAQCTYAGTAFFMKQTGAQPYGCAWPKDGAGADPALWPDDLRVRQFPPALLS